MSTYLRRVTNVAALVLAASAALGLSACGTTETGSLHKEAPAATTTTSTMAGLVLVQRFSQVKTCGQMPLDVDTHQLEAQLGESVLPSVAFVADKLADVSPQGDTTFINHEVDEIAYYRNVVWFRTLDDALSSEKNGDDPEEMKQLMGEYRRNFDRLLDHIVVELKQGKDIPDADLDGLFPAIREGECAK